MIDKINTIGPVNPVGLDDIAEALLRGPKKHRMKTSNTICLEEHAGFWRVRGVEFKDKIYSVDLRKKLLCNGSSKTQDGWAEYSRRAIAHNQFYVGDLPKYTAFFETLFMNRNGECADGIEEIRSFVGNVFSRGLATLTRIIYKASGKDKAMHNFGLLDQYDVEEDIAGKAALIKKALGTPMYSALFGTEDAAEINLVYKWLTNKKVRLQRISGKPKTASGRTVRFGKYHGLSIISCNWDLSRKTIALGIRAEEMQPSNQRTFL